MRRQCPPRREPRSVEDFGANAQLVSTAAWPIEMLGSVGLDAGLARLSAVARVINRDSLGLPLIGQQRLKAADKVGRPMQTKITKCGRSEA